jgi:hypothetical protein
MMSHDASKRQHAPKRPASIHKKVEGALKVATKSNFLEKLDNQGGNVSTLIIQRGCIHRVVETL